MSYYTITILYYNILHYTILYYTKLFITGFPYTWEAESGRKEIDDLKAHVAAAQRYY